ncbi:beta strand repeat-containing protein [Oleiharenicola lentus]|uniref:beta strand repeat-containing protein n=1 Tax=Oleiharenicola lentus TaxID=2508720 RepID=UPI003F66143F
MHQSAFSLFVLRAPLSRVFALSLAFATQSAFAQFNPGPNPVTGTVGAQTLTGGTGTVAVGGIISTAGSTVALGMSGTSTLVNNGTIRQTGTGRAIDSNSGTANLTVTNTGLISTVSSDAFRVNTPASSVTLTNSGSIQVTNGGQAIDWAAITTGSNTLNNLLGGVISAVGDDAVRPGTNGVVNNAGTIQATPSGTTAPSGSDGIDLRTFTGISVTNTGTISGRHGIATDGANAGPSTFTLNNNAGTITALNGSGLNIDGVSTSVTATVTNAAGATIKGGLLAASLEGDGDGIDVDGILTLTNSGDVLGLGAKGGTNNAEGVAAGGGSITNTATGQIIGSSLSSDAPNGDSLRGGNGILIDDSNGGNALAVTTVTNSGLIQGKAGFAVKLIGNFADTVTNSSGGTLRGTGAGAVLQTGDGDDIVTNNGTIQHDTSAVAVSLEGGNDTLNYQSGTITGAIDGGSGANTLSLGNGVTHNYATQNFQTITVASGSASLTGTVSGTSLTKTGAGTLQLTAANDYTGGTTVSAGMLRVNNSSGSATGSGSLVLASNAILAGSGIIGGSVELSGLVVPGNSIGELTVNGDATWNGSSGNAWQFELGLAGASDQLIIGGNFLQGTGSDFTFDFLGTGAAATFILVDWDSSTTFTSASQFNYTNLASGFTGVFSFNGSQLEFTASATAIPEPSTVAAIAGAAVLGLALVRRRCRKA